MGRGSCRIAVDSCVSTCLGRALDNQHSQQPADDGTGVKGFDFRTVEHIVEILQFLRRVEKKFENLCILLVRGV